VIDMLLTLGDEFGLLAWGLGLIVGYWRHPPA
jgi:hypothetical protein